MLTPENHDLINLRAFEVCASGGLLLTDRVSYLIDGEDCLMFNSPEEVNDLLTKIHNCSAIAQQGQLKVINGKNAFSDRAQQLLGLIT